ncbi:hybrid sensor histidine kinase/response regulator [Rariglobus hedericola]|uniref:hybrid sensor histidine kinase/response regulator n=1 Tax=Rariglobus hedericola TaxID=2597822 RepID=UPI001396A2B1|nr:ATP-binding protein [Rariglobus hedericola]
MIPESTPFRFAATAEKPKTIRVLVVEDQEDDYVYLDRILRKAVFARYELTWCSTYEAGLQAVAARQHDVALFDYNLGTGTGLDLLRESILMGCEQPVILLTGHDSPEVDREALGAGASDYLCKNGLNITQLERAIRYSLRHAAMLSSVKKSQHQLELFMRNVPCAVSIRDDEGRYVFQNERFQTHFENAPVSSIWQSTPSSEPRSFTDGEHYWLVNSFPMGEAGTGQLQGLAAIEITERIKAEELLLKATALLNGILKSLPVIAWSVDEEGTILEARGSGLEGVGLNGDQLVGRSMADLSTMAAAEIARTFQAGDSNFILPIQHEGREHAFDTFFHHTKARGRGAVGFSIDITERRWLEKKLLLISDAEQLRIGADLHDGLGQHLTGIACMAAALRDRLKAQNLPETKPADEIARLVNEATAQTRALARGLCPVQLDQSGLSTALEHLTDQMEIVHGIECHFRSADEPFECDHDSALHLYRITQEALQNATRHGKATRIEVVLDSSPEGGRLAIEDNGHGFDMQQNGSGAGVGLRLMRYRAGMIGGNLSIESQPQGGTRVECIFPFLISK